MILQIEIQRFLLNFDLALLGVKVLINNSYYCDCNNKLKWSYPKLQT